MIGEQNDVSDTETIHLMEIMDEIRRQGKTLLISEVAD